jgi:hypothetical protein
VLDAPRKRTPPTTTTIAAAPIPSRSPRYRSRGERGRCGSRSRVRPATGCAPVLPRLVESGRVGFEFRVRLVTKLLELAAGTSMSCAEHGTETMARGRADSVDASQG